MKLKDPATKRNHRKRDARARWFANSQILFLLDKLRKYRKLLPFC